MLVVELFVAFGGTWGEVFGFSVVFDDVLVITVLEMVVVSSKIFILSPEKYFLKMNQDVFEKFE